MPQPLSCLSSTMECNQPVALTFNWSHQVVSCVKAFPGRRMNSARPYQEMRTWKAAVLSATGDVSPALHLWLLLLRAGYIERNPDPTCSGCNKSIRCDAIPIVCLNCQWHFHRTCRRLTRSQGCSRLCLLVQFWGCSCTPPTTTVTSTSVLPCRWQLRNTKI